MKAVSEQQLLECLDLMAQGMSMADILARYSDQSDVLRPYLETTAQLSQLAANPTIAQKLKSQDVFLAQATALNAAPFKKASGWFWLRRMLLPVAALSMFLIIFGAGLITASASSLPGDGLYDIKRQVEGIQLQMASSPDSKLLLIGQFKTERLREVEALMQAGRTAEVEFDGVLEVLAAEAWVVSKIQTEITENTIIEGTPQIGALLRVTGVIENGRLTATNVQVLTFKPADPEAIPKVEPTRVVIPTTTIMPTDTPLATETAVPTTTNEPTNTPTPTRTGDSETPEATNTPESQPTAVPTDGPTPASTPDDDDNDGNDDETDEDDTSSEDDETDETDEDDASSEDDETDEDDDSSEDDETDEDDDSSEDDETDETDEDNASSEDGETDETDEDDANSEDGENGGSL